MAYVNWQLLGVFNAEVYMRKLKIQSIGDLIRLNKFLERAKRLCPF